MFDKLTKDDIPNLSLQCYDDLNPKTNKPYIFNICQTPYSYGNPTKIRFIIKHDVFYSFFNGHTRYPRWDKDNECWIERSELKIIHKPSMYENIFKKNKRRKGWQHDPIKYEFFNTNNIKDISNWIPHDIKNEYKKDYIVVCEDPNTGKLEYVEPSQLSLTQSDIPILTNLIIKKDPVNYFNKQAAQFVYLMKAGPLYKIGKSDNPAMRLNSIQGACPMPCCLIWVKQVDNSSYAESELHIKYNHKRRHGEWFDLDDNEVNKMTNGTNLNIYSKMIKQCDNES